MVEHRLEYQELILNTLNDCGEIPDTESLKIHEKPLNQMEVLGVLNALSSRDILKYESLTTEKWVLTEEGAMIVEKGSPEARVFHAIPVGHDGLSAAELKNQLGEAAKFGQGAAFKSKWIAKTDTGNFIRNVANIVDQTKLDLVEIYSTGAHSDSKLLAALKKRQLIKTTKITSFRVHKGPKFTLKVVKEETDITAEMLASKEWKNLTFKKYNFAAGGAQPPTGHLHPLLKVKDEFRQIFFEMGFSEMPANKYVESSFWNFDALFQPQQHPARDAHDTFFLKEPATCQNLPEDYVERVRKVHSEGGYGSLGYGYQWKIEEARKMVLRTHTTAISSNMLYQLAQQKAQVANKEFKPVKWFSIDRVFRNETLDATHLAEFHQIEGVIADKGLTLGDLIGVLHGFFEKLGIKKLRFKPAYNPYTEPSLEVFAWHDGNNY